jgi:hypothetical protein
LGSAAIVRTPAEARRRIPSEGFSTASSLPCTRSRLSNSADTRKVTAAIENVTPSLVAARMTPPIAGPATLVTLSIVLEVALAAVSSSGVRASEGKTAACAGRKAVDAT